MSFPRYEKYKDSGVEWLGEVPEHWEICSLKRICDVRDGTHDTPEFVGQSEDTYPLITSKDLVAGQLILNDAKYISKTDFDAISKRSGVSHGDVLMPMIGSIGGAVLVETEEQFSIKNIALFKKSKCFEAQWLQYLLNSGLAIAQFELVKSGGVQGFVGLGTLRNIVFPVPLLQEQSIIAAFLDRETTKIDELIAEQQRLIKLLKEKRQAVISHAVTKGLNPDVPMKDSGVEWLGEVPVHWEARRLSSISTKITNGYVGPTRDILVDEGIKYLQSLHIKGNRIVFDVPYFVKEEWSNQHQKSILESGDVLIVQTGGIGQVTVVTDEFSGCNCHALIIVAPMRANVNGEWIAWVLNSDYGFHRLLSLQTGALHPHLNCGNIKDIFIPLPPIDEQQKIVSYVIEKLNGFNELITEAQTAIILLQERRTALISAAVTGKIDVRGFVADQDVRNAVA